MRLVSLCPSITESLVAFGLKDELAGVTRYCIHPREAVSSLRKMGGTKNPDLRAVREAQPDLVFMNGEENRREDIEALSKDFPVDVSHPRRVADVPPLLRHFGRLTAREHEAETWARRIEEEKERLETGPREPFRFVYLIWKSPWMTVSGRTYIADLLRTAGGSNVFEGGERYPADYPEVSEADVVAAHADVLLLPDEPYRFGEADAAWWRERLPGARVLRVSGDDFCWHGVRTLRGLAAASPLGRPVGVETM
jgi:iron complex transport system substrate-binding protein